MSIDFTEILNATSEDIKEPKPLPAGTYIGTLQSAVADRSKQKKTPFIRFTFALESAGEDVDPTQLEEAGGLVGAKGPKTLVKDIYYSEKNESWNADMKPMLTGAGLTTVKEFVEGAANGRGVTLTQTLRIETTEDNPQIPEGESRVRQEVKSVIFN